MSNERSNILKNAFDSIELGMDDYSWGEHKRIVSAVRNFYAGVLLLGKECLIRCVPEEDPIYIISSKYTPYIDKNDSKLKHKPVGTKTIDIEEMESRFKDFGLNWPKTNIKNLQKLRNNLEHFHASKSIKQMQEIIKECFPIIENFFVILDLDPSVEIRDAWSTMLKEKEFFRDIQLKCQKTFEALEFPIKINYGDLICGVCNSSLLYQEDTHNKCLSKVSLGCKSCGERDIAPFGFAKKVVDDLYGADNFASVKVFGKGVIIDCNSCGKEGTYVSREEVNICFSCEKRVF